MMSRSPGRRLAARRWTGCAVAVDQGSAVSVRAGKLIRPSSQGYEALGDTAGLSEEHLEVAQAAYRQLDGGSPATP